MAATTLVKDALWRVCTILSDVSPQFTYWEQVELVMWLNDGQMALTTYAPTSCTRLDAVKLKPGTRQSIDAIATTDCIPGDGSTPTAAIHGKKLMALVRNMGADGLTPGAAIRMFERETVDALNPAWHSVAGTGIVTGFSYDARTPHYFYAKPAVSPSVATWVEMAFVAQPVPIPNVGTEDYTRVGTSTATLSIDDEFVQDLVNYTVARSYMKVSKQGDPTKAAAFTSLFTGSLNSYVTALTGVSPRLTTLPGG